MDPRPLFPLTLAHLGERAPTAPDAPSFTRAVCDLHARADIPSRAARDLVRYEALLLDLTPTRIAPGPRPADDAPLRLAPHVGILVYGADLPGMITQLRSGAPATPRPARGWLILWRDEAGAHRERRLVRAEGWTLEAFRGPKAAQDVVEDEEDRALVKEFWNAGFLVQA